MADGSRRRAARVLLLAGIAVLTGGVAVALARQDWNSDTKDEARVARETEALRLARSQEPRFEIAYLWLPVSEVRRLTERTGQGPPAYELVQTAIGRRFVTNRPPLDRNLGFLPQSSRRNTLAEALRAGRAHRVELSLLALVVTPTVARPVRLRLEVDRVQLADFAGIWDATDIVHNAADKWGSDLANARADASNRVSSRSRTAIAWTARPDGAGAIVPFAVTQLVEIPDVAANADVLRDLGTSMSARVVLVDHVVLVPRRLSRLTASGQAIELDIAPALDAPMIVDPVSGA